MEKMYKLNMYKTCKHNCVGGKYHKYKETILKTMI